MQEFRFSPEQTVTRPRNSCRTEALGPMWCVARHQSRARTACHHATKLRMVVFTFLICASSCGSESSVPTAPQKPAPVPPVVQLSLGNGYSNQVNFQLSGSTTGGSTVTVSGGASVATTTANAGQVVFVDPNKDTDTWSNYKSANIPNFSELFNIKIFL